MVKDGWKASFWAMLRSLQEKAEDDIEKLCTGAETSWLDAIMPKLGSLTLAETADWAVQYLSRINQKASDARKRQVKVQLIRATANDGNVSEDVRKKTIVQILLDIGGHRAVRSLLQRAQSTEPRPLLHRRMFRRRLTADRLYRLLDVPTEFRKDKVDGRIRVGYYDRHIDDALGRLARRISVELSGIVQVEGLYEGWITLRPHMRAKEGKRCAAVISWLTTKVRECAANLDALIQRDGTVLDEDTGRYATAALVVSSADASRHDNAFCGDAFCGKNLLLAVEVVTSGGAEDARIYKKKLYSSAGVPLYVLFDLEKKRVAIHSEPADGVYGVEVVVDINGQLSLPEPIGMTLDMKTMTPLTSNRVFGRTLR